MNKMRRLEVQSCITSIKEILEMISDIQENEQNSYDNLPEGIQDSEMGYKMEDNIEDLDEALSSMESAVESLNNLL